MPDIAPHAAVVNAEGHLIDSQILNTIFDTVIERGGQFEVQHFEIGRTNDEFSRLRLKVTAPTAPALERLLEELIPLGCRAVEEQDALLRSADRDGAVPDDFYSTTNMRTEVRIKGKWLPVARQRMDAVIAVEDGAPVCRKLREVKTGDQVVCGLAGLRVKPEFRDRERSDFSFMSNEVSSSVASRAAWAASPRWSARRRTAASAWCSSPVRS